MTERLILHEFTQSGNCYKIRLTAAHLGVPLERREYDILKGETRTPDILENVNPNGRIPVLQIGDRFLPESNAACYYLADETDLVPQGRFGRADMLRWMFFEQYNHEPNVATLRFWLAFVGEENLSESQRAQIAPKRSAAEAALKLMDDELADRDWLVGHSMSLADICLYAYTHVAGDAQFDLSRWPNVCAWIERVGNQPRHVPIA